MRMFIRARLQSLMSSRNPLNPRAWLALLPTDDQEAVKAFMRKLRARAVNVMYSYGTAELDTRLRQLGIVAGDSIVMQSSFSNLNGFSGEAIDVLDCVLNVIGPNGNLFMVSMPYGGAARDYLREGKPFDVRRTPSQMGLLSELFRRRKGVLRSANPMHPVLAWGPRAEWLVTGHEDLSHSCGENSPFEKMLELDTKALLFDVDLDVLTFTHYLEHTFRDTAPVPVYSPEPIETEIIDRSGARRRVAVYPFAPEAMKLRNFGVLYDDMLSRDLVRQSRVGNTNLQVVRLRDVLECGSGLVARGSHIFARPGDPTHIKPLRPSRLQKLFGKR